MTTLADDPAAAARRRRSLGWSLACEPVDDIDIGQDLHLTATGSGLRDLALVEGGDNLAQALRLALTTALGADPFDVGHGFDGIRVLAEESDPRLQRLRVKVAIAQTLRRDPRVQRVLAADVVADPEGGGRLLATCTFQTVTGDPVTVSVEGVVPGA